MHLCILFTHCQKLSRFGESRASRRTYNKIGSFFLFSDLRKKSASVSLNFVGDLHIFGMGKNKASARIINGHSSFFAQFAILILPTFAAPFLF